MPTMAMPTQKLGRELPAKTFEAHPCTSHDQITCFLTHGSHSDHSSQSPSWQLMGHACWLQARDSAHWHSRSQKFLL